MFLVHKNGYFKEELAPMEVKGKKGKEPFVADEHPREATLEKLQQLKPVFKENGVVTAGNASVSGSHGYIYIYIYIVPCLIYP